MPDPDLARPRNFGGERAGAGQERAGQGGQLPPQPIPNQRGAQRRPRAAAIEPGMGRAGGAEQRRLAFGDHIEVGHRRADRVLLRPVGLDIPPIKCERMLGGSEQEAAFEHRRHVINPQTHPFDQGGEVPGVDRLAVDRGLPAHRLEPGAVGPGRGERVVGEGGIEAGDHCGRPFEARRERRRHGFGSGYQAIRHQYSRARPSIGGPNWPDMTGCAVAGPKSSATENSASVLFVRASQFSGDFAGLCRTASGRRIEWSRRQFAGHDHA